MTTTALTLRKMTMSSTKRLSYDRIAENPHGVAGMTFDEFIARVVERLKGEPCEGRPGCLHCAALSIHSLKRLVEHPADCPECAAIKARDDGC